jgi:hypothetical protein
VLEERRPPPAPFARMAAEDRKKVLDAVSSKHGHQKSYLKDRRDSISDHGRNKLKPQDRGAPKCEHGRRKSECKECGGSSICEHVRIKNSYKDCPPRRAAAPSDTTPRDKPLRE